MGGYSREIALLSAPEQAVFITTTIGKKETLTGLNFSLIVKPPLPPPFSSSPLPHSSLHPSTLSSIPTNNSAGSPSCPHTPSFLLSPHLRGGRAGA